VAEERERDVTNSERYLGTYIRVIRYLRTADIFRVVYRGVTGSFFGVGILPVSDLLDFLGRYY